MRRSWYELYILVVCLSSLIGLVATLFWLFYAVLSWADPELTISSSAYADHQTNERFSESHNWRYAPQKGETARPSDEEITRRRRASYEALIEGQRRFGKLFTLLNGFGVLIAGVLFTIHWRMARQFRKPLDASQPAQSV